MLNYVEKLWGSEEHITNTELYCTKFLNLKKGYQCSLHYHKVKDETFYIYNGVVELEIDLDGQRETMVMKPGDSYRIPPGLAHRFRSQTDTACIIESSTHDMAEDSYRIEESCKIEEKA